MRQQNQERAYVSVQRGCMAELSAKLDQEKNEAISFNGTKNEIEKAE